MKTYKALVGVAICLAGAGIALAAVIFNPTTGMGFVGKGDVQTVLGLNNAQMQTLVDSPSGVVFTYVATDTYEVVNAWATGNADNPVSLNSHTETVTTVIGVNATLDGTARKEKGQKQYTGFNLNGWQGVPIMVGTLPEVSATVAYVTFTWTTQEWTGEWTTDPVTGKKVKVYVTVTHESDQVPVDENGDLYIEGNNKAVLSVTLLDSVGGLYVNGVLLQ